MAGWLGGWAEYGSFDALTVALMRGLAPVSAGHTERGIVCCGVLLGWTEGLGGNVGAFTAAHMDCVVHHV